MKKRMFFCICALMSVVSVSVADDVCPVILPAVNAVDSIVLWGSDYTSCEIHTWDIDMQDTVRIRFTYLADLSNSFDDILFIYELNSLGTPISTLLMTEDQHVSGSVVSVGKSGKARVVLVSQYGGNNGLYNGIKVWFEAHSDSGGDSVVVLNGNVGIDIQPQEKLHINGAVRGDGANGSLRIKTTSGTTEIGSGSNLFSHFYTDRPAFYFSKPLYVNGGVINSYGTSSMLHFRAGGNTDKMRIDGEGVEVLGDLTTENVTAYGTMYVDDTLSLGGPIRGDGPIGALRVVTDGGTTTIGAQGWSYSHFSTTLPYGFYFYQPVTLGDGKLSSGSNKSLQLRTNNITRMVIHVNGNVGIGSATPQHELEVNGDVGARTLITDSVRSQIIVADTLLAKKIRVFSTAGGADYVFDSDYKLRSLDEVGTYIKTNKHLPEIPSADEMQRNGVEIDDFQIRLLQKIEELTLYLIEQQQTIDALKTELWNLKNNKKH